MRLTLREREIFEAIKKEPLISQDELSRRFGITRSSVAVHISNLMKKGVILGKGYVINEAGSAVVIGESCINIDVQTENGNTTINVDYGGFAVEFSSVLSNFGVNVKVITVTGNDNVSDDIISKLREREIDTSNIYRHTQKRSCRRIFVNSISSYEECYSWKDYQKAISLKEWVVFNCEWLCIDPQFQENIIKKLYGKEDEKLPYLCTYMNIESPEDIPEYLWSYSTVVLGVKSDSLDLCAQKVRTILEHQNWILTDGSSRVIYFQNKKAIDVLLLPSQMFAIENRLPFLLAGLIYGLSSGYPLRQAIRISIGAAAGE
jgi:pseudouridine kinase